MWVDFFEIQFQKLFTILILKGVDIFKETTRLSWGTDYDQ